ncbi:MAG: NifB/NifX family molybdenum-iron cluster-binding protein [Candidatus Dojkabacteria bacterium]|nr:NifB/NifX family molybdenum-iron cluster-binding protein [Candidatus Dojkabacteria bacterium]
MRRRFRRVLGFDFRRRYFKPRGVPLSSIKEIRLTDNELETLRLRFIENLNQDEAARKMDLSQSQYQRDLTAAMEKVTIALIHGYAIHVDKVNNMLKVKNVKVLIPVDTKDKNDKMSEVFGRAKYFAIYDTDSEKLEILDNPGDSQARGAGITASQFAIDNNVGKVVASQIGPNAENVLREAGIEVEIQTDKTLGEIIDSL